LSSEHSTVEKKRYRSGTIFVVSRARLLQRDESANSRRKGQRRAQRKAQRSG
jgi:hypothetical protein